MCPPFDPSSLLQKLVLINLVVNLDVSVTLANVAIAAAIFRCEVTPAVTLLRRHLTAECRREHVVYLVYFRGIVPLSCIKQLAISLWRCWNWGD